MQEKTHTLNPDYLDLGQDDLGDEESVVGVALPEVITDVDENGRKLNTNVRVKGRYAADVKIPVGTLIYVPPNEERDHKGYAAPSLEEGPPIIVGYVNKEGSIARWDPTKDLEVPQDVHNRWLAIQEARSRHLGRQSLQGSYVVTTVAAPDPNPDHAFGKGDARELNRILSAEEHAAKAEKDRQAATQRAEAAAAFQAKINDVMELIKEGEELTPRGASRLTRLITGERKRRHEGRHRKNSSKSAAA